MRNPMRTIVATVLLAIAGSGVGVVGADARRADEQARPDGKDPYALVQRMYEVLSGAAGAHDWDTFTALFHEKAIMGSVTANPEGGTTYRSVTPAGYIERNRPFFNTRGFSVKETHRVAQEFGEVLHVFSTYVFSVEAGGGQAPQRGRGINSIQLVRDAGRWWIISIQYTNERPDLPLPKPYAAP